MSIIRLLLLIEMECLVSRNHLINHQLSVLQVLFLHLTRLLIVQTHLTGTCLQLLSLKLPQKFDQEEGDLNCGFSLVVELTRLVFHFLGSSDQTLHELVA